MSRLVRRWLLSGTLVAVMTACSYLFVPATATAMPQCSPIARGDYVHESSGYASGHGWWDKGNCSDPYGEVSIVLWELWTSDNAWHNMGENTGTVRPGGGSSARVTAKAKCHTGDYRWWHSEVTVVLEDGSSNTTNTDKQYIPCKD